MTLTVSPFQNFAPVTVTSSTRTSRSMVTGRGIVRSISASFSVTDGVISGSYNFARSVKLSAVPMVSASTRREVSDMLSASVFRLHECPPDSAGSIARGSDDTSQYAVSFRYVGSGSVIFNRIGVPYDSASIDTFKSSSMVTIFIDGKNPSFPGAHGFLSIPAYPAYPPHTFFISCLLCKWPKDQRERLARENVSALITISDFFKISSVSHSLSCASDTLPWKSPIAGMFGNIARRGAISSSIN